MINGTTLCPHCDTRFRISGEQLDAHQGMVRCGYCMQAFDARPNFVAESDPDSQKSDSSESGTPPVVMPETVELMPDEPKENQPHNESLPENIGANLSPPVNTMPEPAALELEDTQLTQPPEQAITEQIAAAGPDTSTSPEPAITVETEVSLDFSQTSTPDDSVEKPDQFDTIGTLPAEEILVPPLLAEHIVIPDEEIEDNFQAAAKRPVWPWAIGLSILTLLLLAQSAFFFRTYLASHLPALKPALIGYCDLLGCTVALPKDADKMSIESSNLSAAPDNESQITFNALLRNRAAYPLAFPVLALTLNDLNDKPLARRLFKPIEYLPPEESEQIGLRVNHEIIIKLDMNTGDLKPVGYRLELYYPNN